MKKIKKMILASVIAAGVVACNKTIIGEGPSVAQNRPITNFKGIDLLINADIYYQQGDNLNLEVTAQQNILDNLETTVVDSNLVIQIPGDKIFNATENIRINITAPDVNSFSVKSPGSIYCLSDIKTASLKLHNYGSGEISLKSVTAKSIEALTTSAGNIIALDGTAVSENAKASGSGKIDLSGIHSRTALVHNAGSGKIQVRVADHLQATIEGNGPIYYIGYPDVSSHISGTGQLVHF